MSDPLEYAITCDGCELTGSTNPAPAIETCGGCGNLLCADCASGVCPFCGNSEREPILLGRIRVLRPCDVYPELEQFLSEQGSEEAMHD